MEREYCTCSVIIGTWLLQWLHVASRYLQAFSTWSRRSFRKTLSLQSARTHGSSSNWQSFLKCTWETDNAKLLVGSEHHGKRRFRPPRHQLPQKHFHLPRPALQRRVTQGQTLSPTPIQWLLKRYCSEELSQLLSLDK